MFKYLGGFFLFLILCFLIGIKAESILALFFIDGFRYYGVFFGIYAILYLSTKYHFKKDVTFSIDIAFVLFSFICSVIVFSWGDFYKAWDVQHREEERKNNFKRALENLPDDIDVSDVEVNRFLISTKGKKDKYGNPVTFKWGDLTLTDIKFEVPDGIEVRSLTQPKNLPNGLLCQADITFTNKDEEFTEDNKNYFFVENYLFNECNVKEWQTAFNNQKVTLKDFKLYYGNNPRNKFYQGFPIETQKRIQMAIEKMKLNHYWIAKLNGRLELDDGWNGYTPALILNQEAKPVAFITEARSPYGLNNMHLHNCIIRSNYLLTISTISSNNKLSLNLSDLNNYCSENIESSFHYDDFKPLIHKKIVDIEDKVKSIISPYFRLSSDISVEWSEPYSYLFKLYSDNNIPFYWGDLNITDFEISSLSAINFKSGAKVQPSGDGSIKLEKFNCGKDAFFSHNLRSKDNSLDLSNFTLTSCNINNATIKINDKLVKIGGGKLSYHFPLESTKTTQRFFNSNFSEGSENSLTSDYLSLKLDEPKHFIDAAGNPIKTEEIIVDKEGNVIALQGSTFPSSDEKSIIKFGKCEHKAHYSNYIILSNFSEKEVDVAVFDLYSNCNPGQVEKVQYELIP